MYQRFLMEKAVWENLGQSWADFSRRPAREVHDYLTIISLINREQAAAQSSHSSKGVR